MLKRIYIDNFRCLVNFDLSVDSINLFLGPNGSGKTTVFEVLRKIQQFVAGAEKVSTLFKRSDLTRWQKSQIHKFELEVDGNGGLYKYELAVEHDTFKRRNRVHFERLWFNEKPLLRFEPEGEAHLYRDDHSEGPVYPFDWEQSAVAALPSRHDNEKLTWFKDRLNRFIIIQLNPMSMTAESSEEESQPGKHMENFVSWYRYIYQDQGTAIKITGALKEIWPEFGHFKFIEAGEQDRVLRLSFLSDSNGRSPVEYRFDELSEGERTLVALYTLIYYAQSEEEKGFTVCIDEPENFLALPEIQPWLQNLYDFCGDDGLQALLVSHHPELIDFLAVSSGYWFERQTNSPVRVRRISDSPEKDTGLPISELVARGWISAEGA